MQTALTVRGLQKSYGAHRVLNDISFEVRKGQTFALLGANGAGKTTCFYMIVGLVSADGGQIRLETHHAGVERLGHADQSDALAQLAKIHGMAAMGAAHGNGHMLGARLHCLRIPLAEHAQPPAEVAVAIAARRPVVGAY